VAHGFHREPLADPVHPQCALISEFCCNSYSQPVSLGPHFQLRLFPFQPPQLSLHNLLSIPKAVEFVPEAHSAAACGARDFTNLCSGRGRCSGPQACPRFLFVEHLPNQIRDASRIGGKKASSEHFRNQARAVGGRRRNSTSGNREIVIGRGDGESPGDPRNSGRHRTFRGCQRQPDNGVFCALRFCSIAVERAPAIHALKNGYAQSDHA
jgi:hypothetical protein